MKIRLNDNYQLGEQVFLAQGTVLDAVRFSYLPVETREQFKKDQYDWEEKILSNYLVLLKGKWHLIPKKICRLLHGQAWYDNE